VRKAAAAPHRTLWINGRLCRGEEATLSLFDRGARDGEGLFETLRVYGGRPFAWERHMERLVLSAAVLGFPVPASPVTLRAALDQLLQVEGLDDAVARITVTRGVPGGRPTRTGAWVEVEPLAARLWSGTRTGAATAIVSKRPFEPGPLGAHKTTSRLAYHLAREEARVARADETLLVGSSGEVLEGAVSSVFAVISGEVLTPPLACGILPGITRALVLGLCAAAGLEAGERVLTLADLCAADEVFLTNSVQEIVPVGTLEALAIPGRSVAHTLLQAYRREVARDAVRDPQG
jgi:branched-subunit amino acid aminotransferase/4-amino-4-deoxychorismate lyase